MTTPPAKKQKSSQELQAFQTPHDSKTNMHFQNYQKVELAISIGKFQPVLALLLTIATFSAELHSQFIILKDTVLF